MVATGSDTRATAVDDVGVRHSVEDRFEFLPQRFRIFETLVGTQIVAARTVQTARNVAGLGIVVFDFACVAVVRTGVNESVVAKIEITFHEVVVKDAFKVAR